MTDAIVSAPYDLTVFDTAKAGIAEMHARLGELQIETPDDVENYKLVKGGRLECKRKRVAIGKVRTSAKSPHLEAGRQIDAYAKELVEQLEPLEQALKKQEFEYDKVQAERKAEAERVRREEERVKAETEAAERRKLKQDQARIKAFKRDNPKACDCAGWVVVGLTPEQMAAPGHHPKCEHWKEPVSAPPPPVAPARRVEANLQPQIDSDTQQRGNQESCERAERLHDKDVNEQLVNQERVHLANLARSIDNMNWGPDMPHSKEVNVILSRAIRELEQLAESL